MPRFDFPARSRESDFGADVMAVTLNRLVRTRKLSVHETFMVSVAALLSKRMVVALSGSTRGGVVALLQAELALGTREAAALAPSLISKGAFKKLDEKRKKKAASAAELDALATQTSVKSRIAYFEALAANASSNYAAGDAASELASVLIDPNFAQFAARLALVPDSAPVPADLWLFGPGRHCAEPKALQAAYKTGESLAGMTTIWHGPPTAAEFAPYRDPAGPDAGLQLALPCQFCQTNERRIMAYLERNYSRAARPRLERRYSI